MDKAAILTDEQKQQRFRKMLQKRQIERNMTGKTWRESRFVEGFFPEILMKVKSLDFEPSR